MAGQLSWRIVRRGSLAAKYTDVPGSILTIGSPFRHENMPNEVAMLLPTNTGPTDLIEQLVLAPTRDEDAVLGLFLASPFLNVKLEGARLLGAGFTWVTNLPSIVQQDEEFSQQLSDVGLGFDRELEHLAQFRAAGFRIAVVIAGAGAAKTAAELKPEAMIVLPRVADFAAGFPSLRQRNTAVQSAADAARSAGWSGLLLGLGESREADSEALWPARLDGLVCRPVASKPDGDPTASTQ